MKFKITDWLILLCSLAVLVAAQTSRGTVSGIVTDTTGAVITNTTVTLTNSATAVTRTTVSNAEGFYRFDAVDLGTYTLKFTASSFAPLSKNNIVVSANQTATIDAQLAPGTTEISVDITAESGALLQTEVPVRGANIDSQRIVELPVANRNPVSLALTVPGVTTNRFGFGRDTFAVNGGRGRSNNFLIDGTENNDISIAGQGFQIKNPDAVQEVSVQTSNYDAEFGRAGGAVINTITKSGTNRLHGTASWQYDSTRDDALSNLQSLDPALKLRGYAPYGTEHVFAGTIGGPITIPGLYSGKDRSFFFFAYQNQRQNSNTTTTVLTPTQRGRDALRALFPQGRNPRVDLLLELTANALGIANPNLIALGSGRPDIEFGSAVTSFAQPQTEPQLQARVDHKLSEKSQFSARYLFADPSKQFGGATLGLPGFTTSEKNRFQNFLLSETHVFTPSLTNEVRLSYNRLAFAFPLDPPNALGLTLVNTTIAGVSNVTGSTYNIGIQTNLPQGRIANNYVLQDTLTHVRSNHTLRFGFDLLKQRSRQFAPINERGSLTYNAGGGFTGLANYVDDFGGAGPATGSANRDFGSPRYYPFLFRQAYFAQDRWRARESLTLTLGLRYENFGNPINTLRTAAFAGLFNIDPVTLDGPFSKPSKVKDDNNNFSPTIGIAWSPRFSGGLLGALFGEAKTVVRGGYQIGYDSFFNNIASNAASSTPNLISTQITSAVSATNPRGLANLSGLLPTTARPLSPRDAQTLADPNLVNPYYQRWSLGVQRELPGKLLVDASYVGSKGTKLFVSEERNPQVPANQRITPAGFTGSLTCTPGTAGCLITGRLDNLAGARNIRGNGGSSSYHAGQLQVSRRFSKGLSLNGSYTYSKMIDNASEIFAATGNGLSNSQFATIPFPLGGERNERAVSMFDRTHRATITYVYELPFLREQKGWLGQVAGGWQFSGVTAFESGVPFTVFNGEDSNNVGGNNDRPDFNPNGLKGVRAVPSTTSPTGYINPDANNAPIDPATARYIGLRGGIGRTGTAGRNTERTNGINNFDFNVQKRFRLTEGVGLQFRAEFFNVFNHPQYGNISVSPFVPVTNNTGPSANVFTSPAGRFLQPQFSDGGGRVVRYLMKLTF